MVLPVKPARRVDLSRERSAHFIQRCLERSVPFDVAVATLKAPFLDSEIMASGPGYDFNPGRRVAIGLVIGHDRKPTWLSVVYDASTDGALLPVTVFWGRVHPKLRGRCYPEARAARKAQT